MAAPLKLNWCASCGGGRNFGDQLGPILLRHYGIPFVWASTAAADTITVGSILSKVPGGWRGTVLGTGFIKAGIHKDLSHARVLAVRGALTRKACNLPASVPLGDLGLLVSDLPRFDMEPIGVLVIPHTVDHDMAARHPGAKVVPATSDPARILSAIAAAEVVYTSSLHGLIAADALGVPHILEPHPGVHGGLFKFTDYASALGQRVKPYVERLSPRVAVTERQLELRWLVGKLRT
jgi:hypothetical protein